MADGGGGWCLAVVFKKVSFVGDNMHVNEGFEVVGYDA